MIVQKVKYKYNSQKKKKKCTIHKGIKSPTKKTKCLALCLANAFVVSYPKWEV